MLAIGLSVALALVGTLLGTRWATGWFTRHGFGQPIRVDGPTTHHVKRGTPTMGGVVVVLGSTAAYLMATVLTGNRPSASAWLLLLLFAGCAVIGFLDDFIKVYRQHNQGLRSGAKMAGQTAVALSFGILATGFLPDDRGVRPASQHISTTQDWGDQAALGVCSSSKRCPLTKRVTGVGRRIFRIAPVHHHFEHLGWHEANVVIRFWVISGVSVVTGLGTFYAAWLV